MRAHEWISALIAFAVFVVGYAQWRTANQRVVMDLWEKRHAAYDAIQGAIANAMREGEADHADIRALAVANANARFLFGRDVIDYLDSIYRDVVQLSTVFRNDAINARSDREAQIDKKYEAVTRISDFFVKAPKIFMPYMAMTQKNTPFWRPWS